MEGNLTLTPKSDTWIREVVLDRGKTEQEWGAPKTYLDKVLDTSTADTHMRSRNVQFYATGLFPLVNHFSFLDKNKSIDIIPKLLQISMVSGTFQVGETVEGFDGNDKIITFRVASQIIKKDHNNPTTTYSSNPYNENTDLPGYNSASTVLNVDIAALAQDAVGSNFGFVKKGMNSERKNFQSRGNCF